MTISGEMTGLTAWLYMKVSMPSQQCAHIQDCNVHTDVYLDNKKVDAHSVQ